MSVAAQPPLALYVHLPWCVAKCPYCDFNSHALRGALPEAAYVQALMDDLDEEKALIGDRPIDSVFIGGGTPSLFSGQAVAALLDGVRARVGLAADAEITMEANPGAADEARFHAYRQAGVNRLSLGAQSFDAGALARLGRIHDPADVRRAVAAARAAGFDNLNLDLMFALPGQSADQAVADLDAALALRPTHLSHYQLTLEPNTRFHHSPPADLPDEDEAWQMQQRCARRLQEAGFSQYEVSAWSLPERRCRHNLAYWRFGDYAGIGAGAHGKLTLPDGVRRRERVAHPFGYLRAAGTRVARERRPDAGDLRFEYLLNALRLNEGFTLEEMEAATGVSAAPVLGQLQAAVDRGLLAVDGPCWRPTALGGRFLDSLLTDFLPEDSAG